MTTTAVTVGLGGDSKPATKALHPPGGKDSDIFSTKPGGTNNNSASPSFGSEKWNMRSNGTPTTTASSGNNNNNNSNGTTTTTNNNNGNSNHGTNGTAGITNGTSCKSIGSSSPSSMSISGSETSSPTHGGPSPSTSPIPGRRSSRTEDTKNKLFGPALDSPRKVRDRMKSSLFSATNGEKSGGSPSSPSDRNVRRPVSKNENTKNRLFGAVQDSPRRIRNNLKSTIFSGEVVDSSGASTPRSPMKSPIDNNVRRPSSKNENTQNNLFGPPIQSPRRVRDTMKSTIFSDGAASSRK